MHQSLDFTGVVVADDDPLIRGILRSRLEALGQNVLLAADGQEALDFAMRVPAALILLDFRMPRLNGLLACQRLRQLPQFMDTPIVILTSLSGTDAQLAAERVGATMYLTKPFRAAALMNVLARFLPLDEETRRRVSEDAVRAARIANDPQIGLPPPPARPDSALDRGRQMLAAMRG